MPRDSTRQTTDAAIKAKAQRQRNTRELVSYLTAHVSETLSDIYKLEKWEVNKHPVSGKMITIEAVHSEKPSIVVIYNFVLTEHELAAILSAKSTRFLFRTGRETS